MKRFGFSLLVVLASCAANPGTRTNANTVTTARRALPPTRWRPRSGPTMEQLLNVHRASAPTTDDDGSRVVFLSDAPGVAQPFLTTTQTLPQPENTWTRVTSIDDRVHFIRFAPGAQQLFLGRDHGGDENLQLLRLDNFSARTTLPVPENSLVDLIRNRQVKSSMGPISRDGRWLAYASNDRSRGDFDVYVLPTNGSAPARRLFEGTGLYSAEAFAPDASKLVVSLARSNLDQDLSVVDVATGTRRLLTQHTGDVRYENPTFTSDGRSLLVLTDREREFVNLAIIELESTTHRWLIEENHDIDQLAYAPASNLVAVAVNVDGYSEFRLYELSNNTLRRLPGPPAQQVPRGVITSMSWSHNGRVLVFGADGATTPNEIYRFDTARSVVERVSRSDHAQLDESTLVEPSVERVRSFDGTEVPVLLYLPRDRAPDVRAPAVVLVHGGPEGQAQPHFNAVVQYLVGHGYVVVEPNVRGSTGYGRRYTHLDDVALRENSVRDLGEVNRWLRERPEVDPDRIAVMGGSYGGYMTLAAITLQPDRWAAACDIVGIANFRTFLERTAPYRRALREAEYGSLARDSALLERISPIHRVDQIQAPLFVIHGANDPRVPVGEAEQIVAALRARQQRVEYLRFENEGHGVARRENRLRAYGELTRFFDAVLVGP